MGDGVDRADWASCRLSDVVVPRGEKASPQTFPDMPFLGMDHVEAHSMRIIGRGLASEMKSNCSRFYDSDVIYGRLRPYLNKVAIPGFDGLASAEFIVFPPAAAMVPSFLAYHLNARDFVSFSSHLNEGDRPRVSFDQLGVFPVDIPPLVEQRAIVAKIEALFSELDKGVEQLETVKGQLKRYRQSVLKAAFEGKLTAEWRAERARPFVQNSAQLKVAETTETYGTKKPEGWTFVRTGQLTEFVTSGSRGWSKYCGSTGALFIRSQDINRDTLALESVTRVNPPGGAEGNRTRVKTGDILLTITGANVGKCACVDREIPEAYVSQHVALLRLYDTVLTSYLHWVFLSDAFVRGELHRVAYGAGKPGLNLENVKDALVPLAPLPEQRQIVAEIEARFSALDQLEQTVETGLKQAEALRQSILKKAFGGRLLSASERAAVRADPAYEPATRLLERIRGERAAQSGQRGLRGRATKKGPVSTASTPSTVSTPPAPKRRPRP